MLGITWLVKGSEGHIHQLGASSTHCLQGRSRPELKAPVKTQLAHM